jgi:Leucine-rich repeat (LRR) protein
MRKIILLLLVLTVIITPISLKAISVTPIVEHLRQGGFFVSLINQDITNEQFAEMVSSGEIPHNVTELWLAGNQITDISPLSKLTNLQRLHIGGSGNRIDDLTPLANLTSLQTLELVNAQITDITPLANLTNLGLNMGYLSLRRNQITDITPLASLTNLGVLELGYNLITDITPLQNLTNLWWLDLQGNQIEDVMPLVWLTGLDSTSLRLGGNPVADDTEQLAALRAARSRNANRTTLTLGHVLGTEPYTVNDALEILRYTVGLPSVLDNCTVAVIAALIVNEEVPDVRDALQILRSLVGLSSVFDE